MEYDPTYVKIHKDFYSQDFVFHYRRADTDILQNFADADEIAYNNKLANKIAFLSFYCRV